MRLDRCGPREAAGLAKQLAIAVGELKSADHKPDFIDELIARRTARHLGLTVEHNGQKYERAARSLAGC